MKSTKKIVSLSESQRNNSSKLVDCPSCGNGGGDCSSCHGAGKVTMKKKSRINGSN